MEKWRRRNTSEIVIKDGTVEKKEKKNACAKSRPAVSKSLTSSEETKRNKHDRVCACERTENKKQKDKQTNVKSFWTQKFVSCAFNLKFASYFYQNLRIVFFYFF